MLVTKVVKVAGNTALLKTLTDDIIALPRDSYRGPWKDVQLSAEIVVAEVAEYNGNLTAELALPPLKPGEWDKQIAAIKEEERKVDEEFDASPIGQRSAAVLAEADKAIAWLRSNKQPTTIPARAEQLEGEWTDDEISEEIRGEA